MRKLVGAVAVIAALTACSSTTTVVHRPAPGKPAPASVKSAQPKPTVTRTITQTPTPAAATPRPAASTPTPAATPTATATATAGGYLGDLFGGGTGNPCNFASGYQFGVCNPTGETEQQYVQNPGGPAPGTSTNAQGCYYVRMGEGYCPSTNSYVPMQDPNG